MRGERNTDRNTRKFITIQDELKWVQIDRLMTLPQYQKTFNRVINDALDYGLPELIKAEFGEVSNLENRDYESGKASQKEVEFYGEVIRLLGEIIINATINKSILSSLFEARRLELNGKAVSGTAFGNGGFQDTPEFIEEYELRSLKELRN